MAKKKILFLAGVALLMCEISLNADLFASGQASIGRQYQLDKDIYNAVKECMKEHIDAKRKLSSGKYWANEKQWQSSIKNLTKVTTYSYQFNDEEYQSFSDGFQKKIKDLVNEIKTKNGPKFARKPVFNAIKGLLNGWGAFEITRNFWHCKDLNEYKVSSKREALYSSIVDNMLLRCGILETKILQEDTEIKESFIHDMKCYLEQFWVVCNNITPQFERASVIEKVRQRKIHKNSLKSDGLYKITKERSLNIKSEVGLDDKHVAVLNAMLHIKPLADKLIKYHYIKNQVENEFTRKIIALNNSIWSAEKNESVKFDYTKIGEISGNGDIISVFDNLLTKLHHDLNKVKGSDSDTGKCTFVSPKEVKRPSEVELKNEDIKREYLKKCAERADVIRQKVLKYVGNFGKKNQSVISDNFYLTYLETIKAGENQGENTLEINWNRENIMEPAKIFKSKRFKRNSNENSDRTSKIRLHDYFRYLKDEEKIELAVIPEILPICINWYGATENRENIELEYEFNADDYISPIMKEFFQYGTEKNNTYYLAVIVSMDKDGKFHVYSRMAEELPWYVYNAKGVTQLDFTKSVVQCLKDNSGKSPKEIMEQKEKAIRNLIQKGKKPYILIYQKRPDLQKQIDVNKNQVINQYDLIKKNINIDKSRKSETDELNQTKDILEHLEKIQNNQINEQVIYPPYRANNINNNYPNNNFNSNMNNINGNITYNNQNNINNQQLSNQWINGNNNFAQSNYNFNNQYQYNNYGMLPNNMNNNNMNNNMYNNINNNIQKNNVNVSNYPNQSTGSFCDYMIKNYEGTYKNIDTTFFDVWKNVSDSLYQQFTPLIFDKKSKEYVTGQKQDRQTVGLANIGATCYMNATLQCFAHVEPLVSYLIAKRSCDKNFGTNVEEKFDLSRAFTETAMHLWKISPTEFSPKYDNCSLNNDCNNYDNTINKQWYEPYNFRDEIKKSPLFEQVGANDAKDLVNYMIMKMHEELNSPEPNIQAQDLGSIQPNINDLKKIFMADYKNNFRSIISDLFYAVQKTETHCNNCGTSQFNFQAYYFLVFPLEEVRKYALNNAINNFNSRFWNACCLGSVSPMYYQIGYANDPEIKRLSQSQNSTVNIHECFRYNEKVDFFTGQNQIYCNRCDQMANAYYKTELETAPEILILLLNRGTGIQFKIKLEFPEVIDLTNYINDKNSGARYQLIGAITHLGESGQSGHFIASCKCTDGKWRRYNDAIVGDIADYQKEVISFGMPYLLFYKKIH